ncbi:fibronectin type III domain-containing protein [Acanthopleuribacter pedis]|uniref:Fibronectin type III domain-containing protein n=1 Tax=Acanthopleuribacter pedis TaxID=442870 RepID=A0A8J7Q239_9BACT|nr:fibronectin type III domain-containing protein [Acanthopleuribacter pedis]MBO1316932.1 fibronectin type III domain-containing protein [Acanthopleuribacter pedis]
MMKKCCCLLLIAVLFAACEPLETGDPPTFTSGVTATAISQSQIALSWTPATDDLLEPEELSYAIWYSKSSETFDVATDEPSVITPEGAHGYALLGLDAGTEYRISVRARDRGNSYSETLSNDPQTKVIATEAANAGAFREELVIDLTRTPEGLAVGVGDNAPRATVALLSGNLVTLQTFDSSDAAETTTDLNFGAAVTEAHFVRNRDNLNYDDLFVLAGGSLVYLPNSGTGFDISDLEQPFTGSATTHSFSTFRGESGVRGVMYQDNAGAYLYEHDGEGAFTQQTAPTLDADERVKLININGDARPDLVFFGPGGVAVALGDDDDFGFDNRDEVDDDFTRITSEHTLYVVDYDGDGDQDICILERDRDGSPETQFHVYTNNEGTFSTRTVTDYGDAQLMDPSFPVLGATDVRSLLFVQETSNTAVLYSSPRDTTLDGIYGGSGQADWVRFIDINGDNFEDLVLLSAASDKLTVLFGRE